MNALRVLAAAAALAAASPAASAAPLEALVPDVAAHPYRLDAGPRPYRNRLAVSPQFGTFGGDRLFVLDLAYNPEPWLGYEASLGHDPGHAVHAVLHTFNVVVRRPLPGRLQPFATAGYGLVVVYPGQAVNALPVTRNTLAVGGGLECYIRGDLALRGDLRHATVFGPHPDRDALVAYPYTQATVGLAFYRTVRP